MSFVLSDLFDRLEGDVYHRIASDPFFADITVLRERRSESVDSSGATVEEINDIEQDILRALTTLNEKSGKVGACVVVSEPNLMRGEGNLGATNYKATLEVYVYVTPLFNNGDTGTHKSERQIALRIDRLLLGKRLGGTSEQLSRKDDAIMALRTGELPEGARGKRCAYEVQCAQRIEAGEDCAPVVGSYAAGDVTLTCATSGASIYYTTDGSYPGSANTAAQSYSAPFPASSGTIVRATAEKSGLFASDILRFKVS